MNRTFHSKISRQNLLRACSLRKTHSYPHILNSHTKVLMKIKELINKHDKYIYMQIEAEQFGKEFQQFVDTANGGEI